jgi:2-methylcitrate dehydratase PrpD
VGSLSTPMEPELLDFTASTQYEGLPEFVRHQLVRALGDHLGSALAGRRTTTAGIMAGYAGAVLPGHDATVIGYGRICNPVGAALANACAANALDVDDGFRPAKGHPGSTVIPAAMAQAEALGSTGREFLSAVAVGYEVGMRASVGWHGSRPTYNGSGSWGAIGAAAACAHLLGLDHGKIQAALAIAEYHAPFADIMACVEQPSMLKDGIHWGALVGVSAAHLADRGFTGIPQLWRTPAARELLAGLGRDWWVQWLYFKFYPACRWAHPAIAGALKLRERYGIIPGAVARVRVDSFEAAAHLVIRHPSCTEEAQYSLAFPVACAIIRGRVTPDEVAGDGLHDPEILEMADRVETVVDPDLEALFPAEALQRVTIFTKDGRSLSTGPLAAPGDASAPPSDEQLWDKFFALAVPTLGRAQAERLQDTIRRCAELDDIGQLTDLIAN